MADHIPAMRVLKPVLILPGTVLVAIPTILHFLFPAAAAFRPWWGWLPAICLGVIGFSFAVWTVRLFTGPGGGTPAPWDPPQNLVIAGPYRFVRNPMISSVLMMLAAEALIARSWPIAAWWAVFFIGNAVYFPLIEEPGLERRFGDAYRRYKANVPRWIPRLRPWTPAGDGS